MQVCEKMIPIGLALHRPCDPQACKRLWKWSEMVEVKGAYKHGRYEKIWLNSLHVMSNV